MIESVRPQPLCVGDVLLHFPPESAPHVHRADAGIWDVLWKNDHCALLTDRASCRWAGFPFRFTQTDGWLLLQLGESYGAARVSSTIGSLCNDSDGGSESGVILNGHCAVIGIHTESGRVHVWTNRFATIHLYYGQYGRRAAIGTFSPAVAEIASSRQLDWHALTGFFAFGFFPGDGTFFQDVKVLQPATHYEFDRSGRLHRAQRYWQWTHNVDPHRTFGATVDQFTEIFRTVMREHLHEGRVAIPLSGGLDSRSVLSAIDPPGNRMCCDEKFWCYSYGYSQDSIETTIGRELASLRGLPFEAYVVRPYLFERIEDVLAATEGFQDLTQSRQATMTPLLGEHADRVIAAHWGDVWLDDMGIDGDCNRSLSGDDLIGKAISRMQKRGSGWILDNVCAQQLGTTPWREVLREHVRSGLASLSSIEDPDFRVKAFKTESWSFRWTLASLRMFQESVFPRLPFYDTRVSDFMCTVPTRYVAGRRLQIEFLKKSAPDLSRVVWQPYDADLYRYNKSLLRQLLRRGYKKIVRTFVHDTVIERNWELQFGGASGALGLAQWLTADQLRLHRFVDRKSLDAHRDLLRKTPHSPGLGYSLSMLLTFSAWMEYYG